MRVTLLSLEWPRDAHTGGVARYALRLAERLREHVELTVITREGATEVDGVKMLCIEASDSRWRRYYGAPLHLQPIIDRSRPDVIHSFGDDWAIRNNAPMVRTFLGSALGEAKSSRGLRSANHLVLSALEHYGSRLADYRIAIGADSAAEFRCDTVMPPISPIEPIAHPKTPGPSVVFVGSYRGRKRGALVERAVKAAGNALGSPVRLTVFGPIEDRLHWGPEVEHRDGASDSEVREAISEAWLLASPSKYEGFGIPMFEALALGTAVVATPNPGSGYISSILGNSSFMDLVGDAEFEHQILRRLESPPRASCEDEARRQAAVATLLSAADTSRLVHSIYPEAIARFSGVGSREQRASVLPKRN